LAEDRWIEGISIPDFVTAFNLRADLKLLMSWFFTLANTTARPCHLLPIPLLRAGVGLAVIESRADEIVGPVSTNEHKALVGHLGGVRRNWVLHVLGLSAPQRLAEVKLAEGQGAAPTGALEKAKRKRASSSTVPAK